MRRPPGETVANKFVFALVFLLVPWLVDAQQQQNQVQSVREQLESRSEVVHSDPLLTLEATRLRQQAQHLETPHSADRRKKTLSVDKYGNNRIINEHDASAIATLAPASAVRAPTSRRP